MRLLVAEGNVRDDSRRIADSVGATPSQRYADVLSLLAPDAEIDICTPADAAPDLPKPLEAYHGVVVTGSALNIYKREPGSLRQIDFLRETFSRGIPIFGSCWGLQLAAVVAGGEVGPNPRGREVAFARKITLTDAGRAHSMHEHRAMCFDAPAIHGDEVIRLPDSAIVTAWNEMSAIQAAEIKYERGTFWGVQYHPEYDLVDITKTVERYGMRLVQEGFFADSNGLNSYVQDLSALRANQARRDILWKMGLGADLLEPEKRTREIANWIGHKARPFASRG